MTKSGSSVSTSPRWSIRRFILLWTGAILLAFLLLCSGLMYSVSKMRANTSRIFFDSQSLQTNHVFETAIVAEGRQDLLWQMTGDARYQTTKELLLRDADHLKTQLIAAADSPAERELMNTVDSDYQRFRRQATSTSRTSAAAQGTLDRLLQSIHHHRDFNAHQMDVTMRASNRLDGMVDMLALFLISAATVLVVAGGVELWARIFKPTLQLAGVAQQFGSDLHVRAPVLRDDEMGQLARTFNAMAEAIGDREKERLHFVATVAHDLRNPLVVIGGAAHLLKRKEMRLTPDERVEWLGHIEKSTHTLEAMIDDLMDGVQAETGQLAFDMRPLNFTEMARNVVHDHAAMTPTHRIRFEGDEPCLINGDHKRLERVLANLLSNAVKYSERGHEVEVLLQRRGAHAILTVRDEGVGIAAGDLSKLFLPFSRLERTKSMAKGTGLGLSSVKKIIEGHDGTISIQSTLGVGTIIEVCLPLQSSKKEM